MANEEQTTTILKTSIFQDDISSYFLETTFSDLQLLVEGEHLPAHKIVLSTRCEYFKEILLENPTQTELILPNVSSIILTNVLKYIYTETIVVPSETNMMVDMIKLAQDCSLRSLVKALGEQLHCLLNEHNVCSILNAANHHDLKEVIDTCHDFIDEHISQMLKGDLLNQLSQTAMIKFLERDWLPLSEMAVFKLAQKWIETNKDEGSLVIKCVRLSLLTKEEIIKVVRPSKLVDNETLLDLLIDSEENSLPKPKYRLNSKFRKAWNTDALIDDLKLSLEILGLPHHSLFIKDNVNATVIENVRSVMNLQNVCSLLNIANVYNLDELRNVCHEFMDEHCLEVISESNNALNNLTQESMIGLLERHSFALPEKDIFKSVAKWYGINPNADDSVMKYVSLSTMSTEDILSIVWPTKLINCEKLLDAIAEINGLKSINSYPRNSSIEVTHSSLDRNSNEINKHPVNDKTGIVINLCRPCYINHIEMKLNEADKRFFSYYIEISVDNKNWRKIIDYTQFACRSVQRLHFDRQNVRFVRIVGTKNSHGENFELVFFEAYLKTKIPEVVNGIIRPKSNVASVEKNAIGVEGNDSDCLLRSDSDTFAYHSMNSGSIVIQLAQPFLISNLELTLFPDARCSYLIETSTNKTDWQIAVDCRSELYQGRRQHYFEERPVVFIRITGTRSNFCFRGHPVFCFNGFRCPYM